jgi:hypothetical protein
VGKFTPAGLPGGGAFGTNPTNGPGSSGNSLH